VAILKPSTRMIQIVMMLALPACAQQVDEQQVKAAFLYNFAKFVEWPEAVRRGGDPIRLCVFNDDSFQKVLEDTINGKTAEGAKLSVTGVKDAKQLAACQILFVNASGAKRFKAVEAGANLASVLTVGEGRGSGGGTGIINFYVEEGRLRFQVNVTAADRAGLKISSRLLGVATVIRK
jgi:hypothetical protein